MKIIKYLASLVLCLLFLVSNNVLVNAEEGEEDQPSDGYQYKVTFSTGSAYGVLTGANESYMVSPGKTGTDSGYSGAWVKISEGNEKYYMKGWHVAGIEGLAAIGGNVYKDTDYVAFYGILVDPAEYTIQYKIEGTETDLAAPVTYVANVGDKPVVAALHFDGYEPQAYNLTQTLTKDGPNVFRFNYHVPSGGTPGEGGTTYTYIDEGGTITYITVPGGGGGAAPAAGGGAAPGGGAGPAPAVIPDDQTPAAGPADIIDLDDQDTPAGNFSPAPTSSSETIPEPGTPGGGISNAWKIALATGGGIALLLLLLLLLRRKDNNAE